MVPIPKEESYCGKSDAYCYEWQFDGDPSLRFVATGYEDGGGFYFCRRGKSGDYKLLFAVYPAMVDSQYPGKLFWGYAWDINDVVRSSKGNSFQLRAAFGAQSTDDDAWIPHMQRAVPYVLFSGSATQPDMVVRQKLRFESLSLEAIQRRAMANQSLQPIACGGTDFQR